jgi:hypothetical protein
MRLLKQLKTENEKTSAFEGDSFILNEIKEIIKKYNIKTFIETGTNEAKTTKVMSALVDSVHTIELNETFYENCKNTLKDFKNVSIHNGSSEKILNELLPNVDDSIIFYLDAHWYSYCPILDELDAIYRNGKKNSIIVIHDFYVPDSDLGYMKTPGNSSVDDGPILNFEFIEDKLNLIYENNFDYYYNTESDGNPRTGVIFIIPKK